MAADGGGAPFLRLQAAHAKLRGVQKRLLAHAARHEFAQAAELLRPLARLSEEVLGLAGKLASAFAALAT